MAEEGRGRIVDGVTVKGGEGLRSAIGWVRVEMSVEW